MQAGIYPNLSNEEYHSDAAISRSGIISFLDSPYKYAAEYICTGRAKKQMTEAMRIGSAFHCVALEPHLFPELFELEPVRKYLKYDGREEYEEYKKKIAEFENSKKIIISNEEWKLIDEMLNSVMSHPKAWDLIRDNIYEQSYFWTDPHTEIMCKARPDVLNEKYIVDLKTVNNASEKYIQRAVFDYGYDVQMAMMRDAIFELSGNKIESFILICVEKAYPYQIGIYILDSEVVERAKSIYKNALLNIKECRETNKWPSYEPSIITLPRWLT